MTAQTSNINILLIEDDQIDREFLTRQLEREERVSLATATTLHAGIQEIRGQAFDLVVFDLGLPDSYGVDTIRRMAEEFPDVPMIVVTGSDDQEVAEQAIELGMRGLLVKGSKAADNLLQRVYEIVGDPIEATDQAPSSMKAISV